MSGIHLCPGCMRELKAQEQTGRGKGGQEKESRCPFCGFDPSAYRQNPRCLPLNTVLAGKYLVGKVLGEGGFGITYMGYDLNMKTRIAIKEYFPVELVSRDTTRLSEGGGSDRVISLSGEKSKTYRQGLQKYVDEARSVSRFSGTPGIVSVKDFFYENDTAYIVMEYIEGVSLKEYLKQRGGRLPEEEALAILRPVLEALEQVHGAGIVHRDISPDNIMLTFAGADGSGTETVRGNIAAVRLIDFGAARMTAKNDQKSLAIILKHGYAPEEQYRLHGEQGPWTDVYAVCATLYRMLTGTVPEPAMDRLFSDGLKRPEELGADVSPAVSDAVMKGLAVKRKDRIQSAQELMASLHNGKPLKKNHIGKLTNSTLFAVMAAGALLILIVAEIGTMVLRGKNSAMQVEQIESTIRHFVKSDFDIDRSVHSGQGVENEFMSREGIPKENILILEEEKEDKEGESLVVIRPQTSCAGGGCHAVFLKEDGTVISCGNNSDGQRNLSEWEHVAAVAAGWSFSAGLLENGTVVVEGMLEEKDDVERWENITAIAAGTDRVFGLTTDGRLVASKGYKENSDFLEWNNIKAVAAFKSVLAALTQDGRVLCTTTYERTPAEISGWENVMEIVCDYRTVYGLCKDGTVKYANMWSDHEYFKNGRMRPETNREYLQSLKNLQDVVQLYACNGAVFVVTSEGNTICITGEENDDVPKEEIALWKEITGVVADDAGENVTGMKKDGTLVKASINCGNREPETMTNLSRISLMDTTTKSGGSWVTALVGITEEGELQTWGSSDLLRVIAWDGVKNVQDIADAYYPLLSDSQCLGYIWLDKNGTLYMISGAIHGPIHKLEQVRQMTVGSWEFTRLGSRLCAALMQDHTVSLLSTSGESPEEMPEGFAEAENWTDITMLVCCSGREAGTGILMGLKEDGTVEYAKSPYFPGKPDENWNEIISIHAGNYAIGAIKKDGTAVFLEDASEYNYGQYNTSGWTELTQLALGQYHTAGLRRDGTVYATGRNDAGQCNVEGWTDIVWIAAGDSCTIGIRADGTIAVTGEIGW